MGVSVVDKISPFSTPTKPSSKLTSSVEAKENRHTSPSIGNQMKSSTKKNFMSPTISAASKTVAQRKKILAERNGSEATEPTCGKFHRRRSSSFDLKQGSVDLGASTDSLNSSVNEISSVEDGEEAAKLKPYDPVLNYCSPRPKFLLYKPDRRSEILRRYEMIDSTSSESESSGELEECLVKQNVEVTEDAREIDNQIEEATQLDGDAGVSLEEINEKVEEYVEEAGKKTEDYNNVLENIEDHREIRHNIENHQDDVEKVKDLNMTNNLELETRTTNENSEITSEVWQTKDDDETSIHSLEMEYDDEEEGEFEEGGEVERCWSFKRFLKLWFVIFVLGVSIVYISSMNSDSVGLNGDDWKVHSGLQGAPFIHGNASAPAIQDELANMGYEEARHGIKDEIIVREPDSDNGETTEGFDEMMNEESHFMDRGLVVDDAQANVVSKADQVEVSEGSKNFALMENESEVMYNVVGAGNAGGIVDEEFVHVEETATPEFILPSDSIEIQNHDAETEVAEPLSESSEAASDEVKLLAEAEVDDIAVFEELSVEEVEVGENWGVEHLTESVTDEKLNDLEKVEEVSEMVSTLMVDDGLLLSFLKETDKAVIIGMVSSLLLAFVGFLLYQNSKTTNENPQDEASGVQVQDAIRGQHYVKKVDHSPCSSNLKPGAGGFNGGVGAPRVELLGEYTFGEQEVSSYSLRTDYIENYNDSTYSFSQRNMKMSTSQPTVSGFSSSTGTPPYGGQSSQRRNLKKELPTSSIDSPSYGSFTTEMMFRKKEEAQGVEKIIVTPVRRSSRIQSRMTPGASQ